MADEARQQIEPLRLDIDRGGALAQLPPAGVENVVAENETHQSLVKQPDIVSAWPDQKCRVSQEKIKDFWKRRIFQAAI